MFGYRACITFEEVTSVQEIRYRLAIDNESSSGLGIKREQ